MNPDLVQVFLGPHPVGEQIRAVLEGSGIPAITQDQGSAAYPVNVGVMGDSRVMVRREDLEDALALVNAALEGDLELPEDLDPEG